MALGCLSTEVSLNPLPEHVCVCWGEGAVEVWCGWG